MENWFSRIAKRALQVAGSPLAFACAAGVIVLWLATGPFLGFSDTWQLIINTSTTIVTFLMVFVIHDFAEPRYDRNPVETGRVDPHSQACQQFVNRSGGARRSRTVQDPQAVRGAGRRCSQPRRRRRRSLRPRMTERTAKPDSQSPRGRLVAESRSRYLPTQISNVSSTPVADAFACTRGSCLPAAKWW